MTNWNEYSYTRLKHRWESFILARKQMTPRSVDKSKMHITCLDRESLIDNLISRLDCANRVIDSYSTLKDQIELGKNQRK